MFEGLFKIKAFLKFFWKRGNSHKLKLSVNGSFCKAAATTGNNSPVQQAETINNTYLVHPRHEQSEERPDITLRLVHPKSPSLVLVNCSNVIAKDIKWTVVLWNMDLPERNDPLPIPVSAFDWLRPNCESGPQGLFYLPSVEPLLKPGNRLFGSVSVISPESIRGRSYIISIKLGEGGWFSEIENKRSGELVIPNSFSIKDREDYFKYWENYPLSRTPID